LAYGVPPKVVDGSDAVVVPSEAYPTWVMKFSHRSGLEPLPGAESNP
jgi:hypothetical protein